MEIPRKILLVGFLKITNLVVKIESGASFTIFFDENVKVKELILYPGKGISYQRHFHITRLGLLARGRAL